MRFIVGVLALAAGLFLITGPVFGVAVVASGGDLYVRDGAVRVLFDLVLGSLLLAAAGKRLTGWALRPEE